MTTRATKDDPWGEPVNLGPPVNSSADEIFTEISADGLQLYFSDWRAAQLRPGGYGKADIWVTTRETTEDDWGAPENLGSTVNSSSYDGTPNISADGLSLFFGSERPGGFGAGDIWVTTRTTTKDEWGTPWNLGPTINSPGYDTHTDISGDGSTLYWASSNRPGGLGQQDIWQVRVRPMRAIADFNRDGKVDFKDFAEFSLYWFQDEPWVDIAPAPPSGDGIVDFKDVGVFAENWLWLSSTRQASNPNPADGATGVDIDADLNWTPGDVAALHEVYFGSDAFALPLVATQPVGQDSYDPPEDLIRSTTYYWRIDEVNDAGPPPGNWPGVLWSFTAESGKAHTPDPFDEAVVEGYEDMPPNIYVLLAYQPGPTGVKHTGYFSENKADVANRVQDANMGEPPFWPYLTYAPGWPDGNDIPPPFNESLVRGTTYYWAIDEEDDLGNVFYGDIWEFTVRGFKAFNPDPADKAEYVDPNADVSWGAGFDVQYHDVYFGTDFDDVNNAVCTTAVGGVYKGYQSAVTITYDPGPLELSTKYFWRIDEVTGRNPMIPCSGDILTGDVWSFTTGVPSPPP